MAINFYQPGTRYRIIDAELVNNDTIGFTYADANGDVPWGTKWIGHNAKNGGLFNKYRIPFQKSMNITILNPTKTCM